MDLTSVKIKLKTSRTKKNQLGGVWRKNVLATGNGTNEARNDFIESSIGPHGKGARMVCLALGDHWRHSGSYIQWVRKLLQILSLCTGMAHSGFWIERLIGGIYKWDRFQQWRQEGWLQICPAPSNPIPQSHPQLWGTPATASLLLHLLPISSGSYKFLLPTFLHLLIAPS